MRRQGRVVPDVRCHGLAKASAQPAGERVGQQPFTVTLGLEKRGDRVGQGMQPIAHRFGERFQQQRHLLSDHPGDEPGEPCGIDLIEQRERHGKREAVVGLSRREAVAKRQCISSQRKRFRKERFGHVERGVTHQRFAREVERAGIIALRLLSPALEGDERMYACGMRCSEPGDRLVVDQHVLTPCLVLELRDPSRAGCGRR